MPKEFMHINQIGKQNKMQTIQKFRAEGNSTEVQFLKSFIEKNSNEDKEKSDYAQIISSYETEMIFECTIDLYNKIMKKMIKISVSILPI
jgi:predicted oxidoreductase